MSELTEATLDDVLTLVRSASSRYQTLRARVRDWTNYDRVAELQGVAATGVGDEEHFVRLYARSGDGVREQGHGWVRLNDEALYRVLIDPGWLADGPAPAFRGRARVAGREGYLVETGGPEAGGEAFELLPGANRCEYVVDAERGILLRATAFLDDEPLMVEEMVSVDFDAALDDGLFGTRAERRAAGTGSEQPGHWFESNPLWFKTAVFYEIHMRGFFDGNDDGSGDFRGLIEKLDYLQWLGIDCIWLLPMYASPLRDGGYDIADYEAIHPDYGNVEDFRAFVEAAHQRGMRVIADLVMNHTSSDHAWFQESRSSRDSPKRDWYVWSDADDRWSEARIIFLDTEASNWTWDPVSEQYYWHRFFSHQPDLNFDNPEVQEAMIDVLRFWLDLGIDGFRLDAVPYLYERDGTNGENLPETHEYLRRVRAEVDANYPDRVLLAEANQWPADVVEYFGGGDECHMAFHFPVMPRMFMALRREEALPMIEILEQTPAIPDNAQWGLFLRNHDELTLEMVTDEERDYMYTEYAKDPRMRLNLGIRRRLAPLLDNGRDEIELMTAILFSLPGSPVLYYGDEIGMGDNIYLGDRDGVRTPMQWTGDRNGGFSRADFAQLYLPPLMDPVWGFQACNVEAQLRTPTSLLRWLHRFIALRKAHPVFGLGTYEVLRPANTKIFAHLRRWEDDIVLAVHNVARSAQAVELDLSQFAGHVPEEMFGHSRFPAIGELPYLLTLAPRGYFWFLLRAPESE